MTASVTGLVTPCIVRSPVTDVRVSPSNTSWSDLNVIVGYLATSKKSSFFRWASSLGTGVDSEVASIVMSTEPDFFAMSRTMVPSVLSKPPRVVEKPRWLISNIGYVCVGSIT